MCIRDRECIDIFVELQQNSKKWRIRELVAFQIDKLSEIFSVQTTFEIILPLSMKLCQDSVAIVREEAAKNIHYLVLRLYSFSSNYRESLVGMIKMFASSAVYNQRQVFLIICENMMMSQYIFEVEFFDQFLSLATDKVVNVRITWARIIARHFKKQGPFAFNNQIREIIIKMRQEKCKEIKEVVNDIVFSEQSPTKANNVVKTMENRHSYFTDLDQEEQEELQGSHRQLGSYKIEEESPANRRESGSGISGQMEVEQGGQQQEIEEKGQQEKIEGEKGNFEQNVEGNMLNTCDQIEGESEEKEQVEPRKQEMQIQEEDYEENKEVNLSLIHI
eukprot:TRINITY_DN969_c0_g2_i1.p2 TRINITY_DN969_c0_g2~~TRINITY_DN969_c0_g2_i1.p2  ORF type:complete len:333 (-),score=30.19 TRINITY_DN969_c0_g2_i1:4-1002(-)